MYRMLEDEVFQDLEAVIRNTMRTQSLWDETHEDDDADLDTVAVPATDQYTM